MKMLAIAEDSKLDGLDLKPLDSARLFEMMECFDDDKC